jgi:hypothetical protein
VASWRDSTSQQAQDDLDGLLNAALLFAEQTISKYGEMYPFGAAVTADGELKMLAADPGSGEHPASQVILDGLYAGARQSQDEHRAVAFVADVKANGSDAVRVELEHREGATLVLLVPYTRSRLKKTVTLGQISAGPGERRIWSD